MPMLTGWNRRKSKEIYGSASGTQTNYQMKLIIHKGSGTDTTDVVYISNVKDDFSDIRFTSQDGTTLLDYWIESITGTSPNFVATVWIKIDTIPNPPSTGFIYIYYDNPTATNESNLDATFIASDMTALTKVDPNNKITINSSSKVTFTNLRRDEKAYIYKSIPSTLDYRLDIEYFVTGGGSSGGNDGQTNLAGLSDTLNVLNNTTNSLFIRNYDAFHASIYRLYMTRRLSGVESIVPTPGDNYASTNSGYITITRIGTAVTMNVYTNAARTIHAGGSPRTGTVSPAIGMTYAIPLSSYYTAGLSANVSGYIQNLRIRKYASPEPTWGISGQEELPIGDLQISSNPSGAEIFIDYIDQNLTTPRTITGILTGTHIYKLTLANYYDSEGTFDIFNEQTTIIDVPLIQKIGILDISSNPSGAEIYIDNIDQNLTTPLLLTNIAIGSHTYKLTLTNYIDYEGTFDIATNRTTTIFADLIPICVPNWQCEQPLNGYESDGCGNRRLNSVCNPCIPNWRCEQSFNGYEYDGCGNRRLNSKCSILPLIESIEQVAASSSFLFMFGAAVVGVILIRKNYSIASIKKKKLL